MKFLKGMGTGLIVGACLGMVLAPEKRNYKKQMNKVLKSVKCAIEDATGVIGL